MIKLFNVPVLSAERNLSKMHTCSCTLKDSFHVLLSVFICIDKLLVYFSPVNLCFAVLNGQILHDGESKEARLCDRLWTLGHVNVTTVGETA